VLSGILQTRRREEEKFVAMLKKMKTPTMNKRVSLKEQLNK
jgi:hypothetical protein